MFRNYPGVIDISKEGFLTSIFLIGWIGIATSIGLFGWSSTWNSLLVPEMPLPFADMRTVQGSVESIAQGLNPQIDNPGDPWGRRMNYPSVWVWIADFFNFQSETNYLVFVSIMVSLYIYCCYRIMLKSRSFLALLVIFSGSSLLAVERGNNDLVIFTLLYLAAYISPLTRTVPLLIAVALKIFPVLVIPALIKEKANAAVFGTLSIILIVFMWQELGTIRAGTPRASMLSYGSVTVATTIAKSVPVLGGESLPFKFDHKIVSLVLILSVLIVYVSKVRFFDESPRSQGEFNNRLFLFGALIYVGTFLLSGNWDYRLIFLLLCIPSIAEMRSRAGKYLMFACILLAANYLVLSFVLGSAGIFLNILAKCILFVLLGSIVLNMTLNMIDIAAISKRLIGDGRR
jgi:hypothetical protein